MKRYILTGTPGSGKTSIIHELKNQEYAVVEEAATDVIALEQANGNHSQAAKLLGMHPNNLHRLLRNLDLKTGPGK